MSQSRMLSKRQAEQLGSHPCPQCGTSVSPKLTPKGAYYITTFCSKRCGRRARMMPRESLVCANPGCKKTFLANPGDAREGRRRRRYCTKRCSEIASGEKRRGIRNRRGYLTFNTGKAEVPVHRIVMERRLGRPLTATETVHHINGRRDDNRPENLELWDHAQPHGQRVADKLRWCVEYLAAHRYVALTELGPARIMSG